MILGVLAAVALQAPLRLDHVNVVVRDIAAAQADYERLGFAFKAGRLHANSILNAHMKFPDSTELELITATEPRDRLARRYLDLLAAGEGGAYFAMRGDSAAASTIDLPECFFTRYLVPPIPDSARHFDHPNGAYALKEVWLAIEPADSARLRGLATASGVRIVPRRPGETGVTRIVGVTIAVRDASRTARVLQRPVQTTARGRVVLVPPSEAHGIWLEFRENP